MEASRDQVLYIHKRFETSLQKGTYGNEYTEHGVKICVTQRQVYSVQSMKTSVQSMKTSAESIKTNVQGMKTNVQGMKTKVQSMKTSVQSIRQVHRA